jgi:hypothetical protein
MCTRLFAILAPLFSMIMLNGCLVVEKEHEKPVRHHDHDEVIIVEPGRR